MIPYKILPSRIPCLARPSNEPSLMSYHGGLGIGGFPAPDLHMDESAVAVRIMAMV